MPEPRSIQKVLIANRGEIAVRIIRACRDLGIPTVAVYSAADRTALHVRYADEAVSIGQSAPRDSYLRVDSILEAARKTGADAIHPGYGFLAENADFAQACADAKLIFVGPSPSAIATMGDKQAARRAVKGHGVPLVPGTDAGETLRDDELTAAAQQIGFPLMVKAAGGGGGKGIRVVYDLAHLPEALAAARREAEHAFGDPRLFLEKYIESARHIEFQVLADAHGDTVHLFERECSAQRRHQKIVEESPSPLLTPELRARMGAAAVEAARAVGYRSAGTVEFIATPDGAFYFLEMNTRLQVEHPVTEMVTGLDLVKLQFAVAAGRPLPFTQADAQQLGHAIECRLYAEDPHNQFLPAVGRVQRFIPPEGPGIRVDSGVQSGDDISIHYDPMIAKVIVHDATRPAAIRRMQAALDRTVILGTTTNVAFLRALLAHPAFLAGEVDTRFVDDHLEALLPAPPALPDEALIAAALGDLGAAERRESLTGGAADSPWTRADSFRLGT